MESSTSTPRHRLCTPADVESLCCAETMALPSGPAWNVVMAMARSTSWQMTSPSHLPMIGKRRTGRPCAHRCKAISLILAGQVLITLQLVLHWSLLPAKGWLVICAKANRSNHQSLLRPCCPVVTPESVPLWGSRVHAGMGGNSHLHLCPECRANDGALASGKSPIRPSGVSQCREQVSDMMSMCLATAQTMVGDEGTGFPPSL